MKNYQIAEAMRKLRSFKIPKKGKLCKIDAVGGVRGQDFSTQDPQDVAKTVKVLNFYPTIEVENKTYQLPLSLSKWAMDNQNNSDLPCSIFFQEGKEPIVLPDVS